ncbi:transglutaminase domain-containing protein [Haloarchaeobius amylolyticus]|uniref:transglutaminase family protein n=1 Tax=Haloarchaeobius amylolyticus TaxID=1198296 RepID=UPI002271C5A7|nr:transglutaminase domain-containing protein [Haloarchaeobius amylolyticus]
MSTHTGSTRSTATATAQDEVNWYRLFALGGLAVLTATWVTVLYKLTQVVGGSFALLFAVTLSIALAAVLSRVISEQVAGVLAATLLVGSYLFYILSTPNGLQILVQAWDKIIADTIALLTGLTILRLKAANLWILGFAPAPVFFSWFLAFRRRYVWSAVVGGLAFLVLILTGDAATYLGNQGWLLRGMLFGGTLGGIAMVGFGELERRGGSIMQADVLVVLFTLMLIASAIQLPFAGSALRLYDTGPTTVEGSLTEAPGETTIMGSIELSPEVRFTAQMDDPQYMRVGAYDRFTGGKWIRTGQSQPYSGSLDGPPGETERMSQLVTIKSNLNVMPAANQPVRVDGQVRDFTQVTELGSLRSSVRFQPNDTYRVISEVPTAGPSTLRTAGTDYPDEITSRYLADSSQPDFSNEFEQRTQEIVAEAGAENPYEQAVAIERWLEANKEYSLEVDRPRGNIAENFVLDMDRGYCVYYATAMTMMLRAQDIPARYVVGYTPGQQVDENEWVMRGLNSHAWVEVYFPDVGWVKFDPTPAGPREDAEYERVSDARSSGEPNVDTGDSADEPLTTTPEPTETTNGSVNGSNETRSFRTPNLGQTTPRGDGQFNGTFATPTTGGGGGGGFDGFSDSQRRMLAFGFVAMVGLAASAHRAGVTGAVQREAKMRWQGARRDPETDVVRAVERLELLLERRYRPRRTKESPRRYISNLSVSGLDARAERVGELHEKAVYGPGVSREEADEAVELVDELVRAQTPILRRFSR